jgi:hypothetical protein
MGTAFFDQEMAFLDGRSSCFLLEKRPTPSPRKNSLSPVTTLLEPTFPDSMSDEEVLSSNFSDMLKRLYIYMYAF